MTCDPLVCNNHFISTVTKNKFLFYKPGVFSCKSHNVIYLSQCTCCGIQCVGMTEQRLHQRMNGHRSSAKAGQNQYIYQHFQQDGHNFENATVQIIDYIDSNTVPDIKKALADLEQFWINTLSTAYPLGLNDNIKGSGNISQSSVIDVYFTARITRYNRGHGRKSHLKVEKRKYIKIMKKLSK